jgi:two-component system, NtrC family, nitrogen regulation response regulator GlnG
MHARNASILLVDDDVELSEALTKVLRKEGFQVAAQQTTEGAMSYLRTAGNDVDLVITDGALSGVEEMSFVSAMKSAFPTVPVMLINAYGHWGRWAEALRAGAFEYLSKPLDKFELLAAVQRALDHRHNGCANAARPSDADSRQQKRF